VMKPGDRRGYVKYSLTVDAVPADVSGHRLVWETFNGPIPAGLQINHKNGVKNDNRLENLEVCTQSENLRHRHRTLGVQGTKNPVYGERNGKSKLRREDIEKIRALRVEGWSQQKIADQIGIHQTMISAILRGRYWVTR
jgi:DNA-binding XRE family transcriptional regulator